MRMPDGVVEIFLQPGEWYFGDKHTRIRTVLGSCVSAVFWHPGARVGGMCHFMLPSRGQSSGPALDGRYTHDALVLFDREVAEAGSRPGDYQVKGFGVGNMLTRADDGSELMYIAARNVESAYALLARHGYRPAALAHCGGKGHRKLIFDLWTGHVWLAHRPLGSVA